MRSSRSIFAGLSEAASGLLLFLSLAGCGPASQPAAPTLEAIVEHHTQARGGRAAIEAIRILEAKLRIVEPAYTAEGLWQVDRKGRMHIDVFIDGKRVWSDFRPVAGVQFAFQARDTDLATGKLLQTTELLDLKANPPLDEQLFQLH
jgi:hypothetical protein